MNAYTKMLHTEIHDFSVEVCNCCLCLQAAYIASLSVMNQVYQIQCNVIRRQL